MDVTAYGARLHRDLYAAGQVGGDEALAIAEKMAHVLDPSIRLVLLDALVEAAGEITDNLPSGSVEVRLLGREVQFAVTAPTTAPAEPVQAAPASSEEPEDDGGTARLSLRLPDRLKGRVEEAAGAAGLSVNAWLVRSIGQVLDGPNLLPPPVPPAPPAAPSYLPQSGPAQRITGWVR
ncbi:hypothetical protein LWF15_00840 [Kineosporia rhizophila]|uniref:hypothetical protein n=1 Tax=Kineosporia rhizophila TaxID=84633 RepID=UPI001E611929|nr:hypothetical protein [Kineosporia rhizophila]MCE0534052.1 hypothetical protein [Kineosporia rhizophila]